MRLPALRAALRIARRDARRAPARSLLVVAMIALPVVGLTSADVLARTAELSPADKVTRQMGPADAVLSYAGGPVKQSPSGKEASNEVLPGAHAPTTADVLRDLPPGSQVVTRTGVQASFGTRAGIKRAELIGFDYAAPPVRGMIRQVAGRPPRTGDEIALSRPLAGAIEMGLGDSVRTTRPEEKAFRVVGIVEDPYDLKATVAYTVPAGLPAGTDRARPGELGSSSAWFASTVRPVDWRQVLALNAKGYLVKSREVLLRPPPRSQVPYYADQPSSSPVGIETVAIVVLAVGMALLEVVLLAGPAFAVGARRRRRELALVAATGGERRDVRNIVLAGGAVLGLTAAAVGIALGIGLAAAVLPLLERLTGSVAGRFDVRPLDLTGVALVGLVTGLAAALLPARAAARQDVVTALAGRRGAVRTRARVPLIGLTVAVVGAVIAVVGAVQLRSAAPVLAGAVIGEIGLIACTPALLGLAGRLGRHLPPSPRLALRDAARNRSSATPAVAAIMAAVAGSVAVGIGVGSLSAHDRAAYQPQLAHGDALVQLNSSAASAAAPQVADTLRAKLPARHVAIVRSEPCHPSDSSCLDIGLRMPPERACPAGKARSEAESRRLRKDPRCAQVERGSSIYPVPIIVDDGDDLPRLIGAPASDGVAALRAGKAIVFDRRYVKDGKATFTTTSLANPEENHQLLPAIAVSADVPLPQAVLPTSLARQLGMRPGPIAVHADNRTVPTEEQEQATQGALDALGDNMGLVIERGYVDRYNVGLLALVVGAGLITLGAAGIATALSNVDSQADLVTLAAVGASPRVRRLLSMSRAGVIAVLGTALGTLAGFVPAVGLILAQRALDPPGVLRPLDVPWPSLAGTAILVPAIAILIAGLFSRSRLPVERRSAT